MQGLNLNKAKQKAVKVIMSSILPRQDANKTEGEKIDTINYMLVVLCNEKNVTFVNHDKNFKYRDNTPDILLLGGDRLHLAAPGISKLLVNLHVNHISLHLEVHINKGIKSNCTSKRDPIQRRYGHIQYLLPRKSVHL